MKEIETAKTEIFGVRANRGDFGSGELCAVLCCVVTLFGVAMRSNAHTWCCGVPCFCFGFDGRTYGSSPSA